MAETKHKVFIVDDHALLRDGLAQLINQDINFQVCGAAGDVQEALHGISDCRPDVAVIDISLGDSSGIRLIENLKHLYPELAILTLSMHDESLYAERCLKAGAMGYIMKQEPSKKVMDALRTVMKKDIYVSKNFGRKYMRMSILEESRSSHDPAECLSNRELEVFEFMGRGFKTLEIAERLNLSVKTINTYILHIKSKMDLKNIREVITRAAQWVAELNP
ncbi:MAG: response regulator transcription factor [Nitrospiraceae bacterium]|nr:MAG: response regulator transcription factor [Nitrospiraceae bacterium]